MLNENIPANIASRVKLKTIQYLTLLKRPTHSEKANVSHRFVHGVTWGVLGGVGSRFFTLLSSIIIARALGKTVFGEYGIIQSTVGMFGVFAGLGLGLTATKYVAEYRYKDPARAERILGLSSVVAFVSSAIVSIIFYKMAPFLAVKTIAAPHLTHSLQLSVGLLFLGAVTGAQTGALAGFEAFKKNAFVNFCIGFLSIPITFIGVWRWGLVGAIWSAIIVLLVNWIVNHIILRTECRRAGMALKISNCWSEWPILWRYSLPATMSGIVVAPVLWTASAMLVNQPGGYAEMGVFNAANQWRNLLLFIPTIIGQIITPILSEQLGEGNHQSSMKALKAAMFISGLVAVPLALILAVLSPWIMRQYGTAFANGWPVLLVVLATASLLAIQSPVGNVIAASGRMWLGTLMNAGWGIAVIASIWLLLPLGALGLASAFLIAYVIHCIWTFWFARRFLSTR